MMWQLGLDASGRSICTVCPSAALDPLDPLGPCQDLQARGRCGHMYAPTTCWIWLFTSVHPSVSVEKGHSLARDHTRPVEIHIAGGNSAESVALHVDITDTSPLCFAILGKLCEQDREAPCR